MVKVNLNEDWSLRYENLHVGPSESAVILRKKDDWLSTNIPCDVHVPLVEHGIIDEPIVADNSFDSEWIEEKSWWFKKEFTLSEDFINHRVIEIMLESLDAEADIFLNGSHLGHQKSSFYPFTKDVKPYLQVGTNTLLIRLTSGVEHYSDADLARLKNYVGAEGVLNRGEKRRIFVRKPQYVYGWDWGPRVATCGIMKDVTLEALDEITVRSTYAYTKKIVKEDATVAFEIEVDNLHPFSTMDARVEIEVTFENAPVLKLHEDLVLRSGINYIDLEGIIENAKLWWPNNMGDQPLYSVKTRVITKKETINYKEVRFGIKTIKLNQQSINEDERLFAIEINGERTLCKGGNWIPADSIYSRVPDEKYETLIHEAKEANFNMLRIWGGGFYEKEIFYEKCDENGLMIWHDFMFACSMYPDDQEWFQDEVRKEMDYQTKRLRNHPSIAIWCGNNENSWGFDQWWGDPEFLGGANCYNDIAPQIIRKNCPQIPYWNSSPYGGVHPNGDNMGNKHHWHECTMNPDMSKRITPEEYDKVEAKFVSEYGYIGPCSKSTIEKYHGDFDIDREGRIWSIHNNTFEKETVPAGITKHYVDAKNLNLDDYLLYAGLCQGLMLNYSLEALRFKENCSGSLFWMYNDCWGEVGWTIIDYYLKRKPSYYYVKRAFAPMKFIIREENNLIKIVGINETTHSHSFAVEFGYTSFDGKIRHTNQTKVHLDANSRSIILEIPKDNNLDYKNGCMFIKPIDTNVKVDSAILRTNDFNELNITKPTINITSFKRNGNNVEVTLTSATYCHAVHFGLDDEIRLSDEYFDLLPGEAKTVTIFDCGGFIQSEDDLQPKYVCVPVETKETIK